MTIDCVLGAELAGRAVPTAGTGEPYESLKVTSDDRRVELRVWEVTPGSLEGSCDGWSGVCGVDETVRKTYAIVKTS